MGEPSFIEDWLSSRGSPNYSNEPEQSFAQTVHSWRWSVYKGGWPDFFCQPREGPPVLVEVKPDRRSRLSAAQTAVMGYLSSTGVTCLVWTPTDGPMVFDLDTHGDTNTRDRIRSLRRLA